ncbi:uncharacterized protein LOC122507938 [Leptopilina heterotoma]|uniref:uncharacterized protein LOC122507938 n=1 Tax=Leptopilina heterotoma TaxID=63436 RepID=UPI001CA98027|nr:uncharacterized protein LOC122507938 [Leptopilina heterotoma]
MKGKKFSINLSRIRKIETIDYNKEEIKFRGEDSQLFQAISPAFYIIRVFGLGPYYFSGDRLVPSNVHLIFSLIGLLFNSYVTIVVLIRFSIKGNQPILGVTEQVKVILNYGTSIVNILVAMCTRERMVQVWSMIQDFDCDTNIMGFPQMERGTKFRTWSIIMLNTVLWVWISQAGILAFSETWLQNASYLMIYIATCVSVYEYSGIVIILGTRFKHLNKIAVTCSPNQNGWGRLPKIESKVIEKLHGNLMIASRILDSVYSWPLLLWLFNLCSHTVSNTYFIITAFMDHDFEIIIQICLAGWFIIYVMQLMVLHVACDFTSYEANRLGDILLNWRKWQVFNDDALPDVVT